MWKLPTWYGTILVCMMIATMLSLYFENAYKTGAFMYGSIFNLNVIVLLFAISLPTTKREEDQEKGISNETDAGEKEQTPNVVSSSSSSGEKITDNPPYGRQQQEKEQEPSSGFVSFDEDSDDIIGSINDHDHSKHNDKRFFCCFCWNFSYPTFFILAVLLSIIVSCATLPREIGQSTIYVWGPHSSLFLITHGALIISIFFSWIERGYGRLSFSFFHKRLSKKRQDGHDGDNDDPKSNSFLNPESKHIPKKLKMTLSFIFGVICFIVAALAIIDSKSSLGNIRSFTDVNNGVYDGEAYVAGFTLLDDDDGDNWCASRYKDSINVNVTVAWGGQWGCPSTGGTYCEVEMTTQVSCKFDFRDEEEDMFDSPYDYVNNRYHENHSGDDDAYDEYGFDEYDIDTKPQYMYWNRPSEFIYGNCNTCEARSFDWMMQEARELSSRVNFGSVLIGMGMSLICWPLVTLFVQRQRRDNVILS